MLNSGHEQKHGYRRHKSARHQRRGVLQNLLVLGLLLPVGHPQEKLKICPRGSAIIESCAAELEELEKGVYWDLKVMIKLMKKRDILAKMVEVAIARVRFFNLLMIEHFE